MHGIAMRVRLCLGLRARWGMLLYAYLAASADGERSGGETKR